MPQCSRCSRLLSKMDDVTRNTWMLHVHKILTTINNAKPANTDDQEDGWS